MTTVLIDGQKYVPLSRSEKYGVAISTHNRFQVLKKCLPQVIKHCDDDTPIVVVADNKQTLAEAKRLQVPDNVSFVLSQPGVYNSKNKGLEELIFNHECHHLFLLDDDIYPIRDDWAELYITAPEQHYAHSFNLPETYRDSLTVATTRAGGTMLYYTADIIKQVGGMRKDFGTWGHEHVNLSDRIHNNGLTTFRYQDLAEAYDGKVFYEMDNPKNGEKNFSSSKTPQQADNDAKMWPLYEQLRYTDTDFIEYRRNLPRFVLTCYMDDMPNPQGSENFHINQDDLKPLAESLPKPYRLIVLTNTPEKLPDYTTLKIQTTDLPVDFQRWHHYRNALKAIDTKMNGLKGVEAWCVDATDVIMLNTPHPDNELWCGYEPQTVGCKWMTQTTDRMPDTLRDDYKTLEHETLLNGGVIGGDAYRLMSFLDIMDTEIDRIAYFWQCRNCTDMHPFQLAAHKAGAKSGAQVTSVFKGSQGIENAWWAHKLEE